jgi:transcriptional antiterminator NusG
MRRTIVIPKRELSSLRPTREVISNLFGCYSFVWINYSGAPWRELFQRANMRGTFFVEGEPYRFPEKEIARIKGEEINGAGQGETLVSKLLPYQFGERLRIKDGPFASFTGSVHQLDESGRMEWLAAIFGRETPVALDVDQVERL